MLKKRIIPCLDIKNGNVVKGIKFDHLKQLGDPIELAKYYSDSGADELVVYDIAASNDTKLITLDLVSSIAKVTRIPLTVGGGIKNISDVDVLFSRGADKVSINSGAINNIKLIEDSALKYGNQSIVGSVDVKWFDDKNEFQIVTGGGRIRTNMEAIYWIACLVDAGIGELVVNMIDNDGMKNGYDIKFHQRLDVLFNIPIIASGGAGKLDDFYQIFQYSNTSGALAASLFHQKSITIDELKMYLIKKGVPIRV
jgi:cyclase